MISVANGDVGVKAPVIRDDMFITRYRRSPLVTERWNEGS